MFMLTESKYNDNNTICITYEPLRILYQKQINQIFPSGVPLHEFHLNRCRMR